MNAATLPGEVEGVDELPERLARAPDLEGRAVALRQVRLVHQA